MRPILALFMLLCGQSAWGQLHQPPAALEATLPPRAFEELCFELEAGASMRYAFDAAAPLDFNLHWHQGEEVRFPVQIGAVARIGGVFRATEKQAYCLMWTNRNRAPVALRARIDRAD